MPELVLPFREARALVERHAATIFPPPTEVAPLLAATGRTLASRLICDRDLPPFDRSTRDGYAVRASDLTTLPATLKVVGELRAGGTWKGSIGSGEALEIMTGAGVPKGADSIVMVEFTRRAGDTVIIERSVEAGENVVARGSEAGVGQTLVNPGTFISPAVIALGATVGVPELATFVRPRVAVLATGDELVEVTATPGPSQIRNSNSYSLAAQVTGAGAQPIVLPRAPDEEKALRMLIRNGLDCDLLLLSGGVSMGKYDLVEQVLRDLGAEFIFTGVQIQPGKPLVFGRIPRPASAASGAPAAPGRTSPGTHTYFFGLPGNPVSTMVTFGLFVRPIIDALAGATAHPLRFMRALLASKIRTKTGLTRFLPARLSGDLDAIVVELIGWHGSGDLAAVALADCFIVVPPDRSEIPAGEFVPVLQL
jgi:molybdopterin molybdotransferase